MSKERRLSRWLHDEKIVSMAVYQPLMKQVLAEWANETAYLTLDTS
ncbi:MAG: hypothetical protein H6650_05675 [Ardenticatenales bacterium]|nr:hypothetical protein [Ardenticatenales bacterium]